MCYLIYWDMKIPLTKTMMKIDFLYVMHKFLWSMFIYKIRMLYSILLTWCLYIKLFVTIIHILYMRLLDQAQHIIYIYIYIIIAFYYKDWLNKYKHTKHSSMSSVREEERRMIIKKTKE